MTELPPCPRCHVNAFVRLAKVISGLRVAYAYHCGRCNYEWQIEPPTDTPEPGKEDEPSARTKQEGRLFLHRFGLSSSSNARTEQVSVYARRWARRDGRNEARVGLNRAVPTVASCAHNVQRHCITSAPRSRVPRLGGMPIGDVNTSPVSSQATPAPSRSSSWRVRCAFNAWTTTAGILMVRRLRVDFGSCCAKRRADHAPPSPQLHAAANGAHDARRFALQWPQGGLEAHAIRQSSAV